MRHNLCVALLTTSMVVPVAAGAATPRHIHHSHRAVRHSTVGAGVGVSVDEARLVTLARPAKTIFVGNPTIADISVLDSRHAFLLGKTMGMTNLIALDADGAQISNQSVTVINGHAAITLNQGALQYNYTCTRAHCETMPRPGDPLAYVTNTEGAITSHEDAATKNAAPPAGSQTPAD